MLVLAVALAGCSSIEYQATLAWQDEEDVQKIRDAATAAGQVCPLVLLAHDMVPDRLTRVEYTFSPWATVTAYAEPVEQFQRTAWLMVQYPDDTNDSVALAAARQALAKLSTGTHDQIDAYVDALAQQRDKFGLAIGAGEDDRPDPDHPLHYHLLFLEDDPQWSWGPWFGATFPDAPVQEKYTSGAWTVMAHVESCWVHAGIFADIQGQIIIDEAAMVRFILGNAERRLTEDETRSAATAALEPLGIVPPPGATFTRS